MASPYPDGEREKVASKLPSALRQEVKIAAAERGIDIQDVVTAAVTAWMNGAGVSPTVDTSGADSYSTWLPTGLYDDFKVVCTERGLSNIQGLAQSVHDWLEANRPTPPEAATTIPQRKVVINQKGGVGKTSVAAGVAQAYAEAGLRTLLVDYDPQGHLTEQLGQEQISPGEDSLVAHMCLEAKPNADLRQLIVAIPGDRFGRRLHLLPAAFDGFLLDAKIATNPRIRRRETVLETALRQVEDDYDVIVVDCPPSLGLATDAAIYYGRRRKGEAKGKSGAIIPVLAEDSSATAYTMLTDEVESLTKDLDLVFDYLGLVVNMYDSRRGYVATSSLEKWKEIGDPPVLAIIKDMSDQRKAVRMRKPLLEYAPDGEQAERMRKIAKATS